MIFKTSSVWVPWGFTIGLCSVALIANLAGIVFTLGRSDIGMIPFLCFLPHAFFLLGQSQSRMSEHVKALEHRIAELESAKPTTSNG